MPEPLDRCVQPPDDAVLWRYLDFTKFVDLISTKKLFFSRADKLGDPFEGSYTATHIPSESDLEHLTKEQRQQVRDGRSFEIAASRDNRKLFFINCWHLNPAESAAMWKLYSQSNESVAIQTTFGKLKTSLAHALQRIDCGAVNYLDYNTERIEEQRGHLVFMSKRKSFEHEREVRLIFWSVDDVSSYNTRINHEPPPGYPIDCDLGELIQSVYVSPASQDWYLGLVRRMCAAFGVGADVKRSDLANSPFH